MASDRPDSISSTLLERVRARQPEAWQRLVDLFGPVVYRWCRQAGVGPEDGADLTQEVFQAVVAHIGSFREGGFNRSRLHQPLAEDDSFSYSLDPSQQPKRISLVRSHFSRGCVGIYRLQGDRLTIHLSKDQLPTDVAAEPREGEILLVLKRAGGVASASPLRVIARRSMGHVAWDELPGRVD